MSQSLAPTQNSPSVRLVCLPHAGGTAAAFYRWRPEMPQWVELLPMELPGHGTRLRECPRTVLRQLASELANELRPAFDRPVAMLGHSMGAWLAFEIARELRRRGAGMPQLLIVASTRAPHFAVSEAPMHALADDELVKAVVERFDGIPQAVRESPEMLPLVLPALRADLQMVETYECDDEAPLGTPIFAIGGADDSAVSPTQLDAWRGHTAGEFESQLIPGGHFALFGRGPRQSSDGLSIVLSRLARLVRPARI